MTRCEHCGVAEGETHRIQCPVVLAEADKKAAVRRAWAPGPLFDRSTPSLSDEAIAGLGDTVALCGAHSNQGTICERSPGHGGCHEAWIDGDSRRWWGDSRWAPWEWMVYEFETSAGD